LFQLIKQFFELFRFDITVHTALIFYPLRPGINPGIVVPVAVLIPPALEAFDIFQIFFGASLAKVVWYV
jgi:hypothetical protein